MYEAFYGLSRRPFPASPDADGYVPTPTAEAAREALSRCLQHGRGIALLTAAPGLGKSSLAQKLANELEPEFATVFLANAGFTTKRSLLQAILYELGHPYVRLGEQEARLELTTALRELQQETSGLVLIIDEAHLLNSRLLEELRALSNQSSAGEPLLRLLLCADLELEETLAEPGLDAFNQRVACHVSLDSLNTQESLDYLQTRLTDVGSQPLDVFTSDALLAIARAADGSPRCLNQLADHALLLGYVAEERPIAAQTVHDALQDLKQLPLRWNDLNPVNATAEAPAATEPLSELPAEPYEELTVAAESVSAAAVVDVAEEHLESTAEVFAAEEDLSQSLDAESPDEGAVDEILTDNTAVNEVTADDDSAAAFVEQTLEDIDRPAPYVFETGADDEQMTHEETVDVDEDATIDATATHPAEPACLQESEAAADLSEESALKETATVDSGTVEDVPLPAVFEVGGPAEDELVIGSEICEEDIDDPLSTVNCEPEQEHPASELLETAADVEQEIEDSDERNFDEQIDESPVRQVDSSEDAVDPAITESALTEPENSEGVDPTDVAAFMRSTLAEDDESFDADSDGGGEPELTSLPNEVTARFADFVVDKHVGLRNDASQPSPELALPDDAALADDEEPTVSADAEPATAELPGTDKLFSDDLNSEESSADDLPSSEDRSSGTVDTWVDAVLTPAQDSVIPDFPVEPEVPSNPDAEHDSRPGTTLPDEFTSTVSFNDFNNDSEPSATDCNADSIADSDDDSVDAAATPAEELTADVAGTSAAPVDTEPAEAAPKPEPLTLPAELQQQIAQTADAVFLPEWEHEIESVTASDGSDAELRAWGVVSDAADSADDDSDAADPLADLAAEEERFPQPEPSPHAEPEWPVEPIPDAPAPGENTDSSDTQGETSQAGSQSIYEQYDESDPRRRLDEVLPLLEELIATSSAECDEMLSAIDGEVPADAFAETEVTDASAAADEPEAAHEVTAEQMLESEDSVTADRTVPSDAAFSEDDLESQIGALVLDTSMEVHAEVHGEPLDDGVTRALAEELQQSANAAEFFGDNVSSLAHSETCESSDREDASAEDNQDSAMTEPSESAAADSAETILADMSTFDETTAETVAESDDVLDSADASQADAEPAAGVDEELQSEPASVEEPAWQYDIVEPEEAEEEATIEMATAGRLHSRTPLEPEQKRYRQLFSQLRRRLTGDRNAG